MAAGREGPADPTMSYSCEKQLPAASRGQHQPLQVR